MWTRYRFKTLSVTDYRPLVFDPRYPWWCSGENDESATIIAWLPVKEDLLKYWDDAFEIESSVHGKIEFTDRFDKPDYFIES